MPTLKPPVVEILIFTEKNTDGNLDISKNIHISASNQCKEGGRVYMGVLI